MGNTRQRHAVILMLALVNLFLMASVIMTRHYRAEAEAELTSGKLRNEALLSEKLSLEKRLAKKEAHSDKLEFVIDNLIDSVSSLKTERSHDRQQQRSLRFRIAELQKKFNEEVKSRSSVVEANKLYQTSLLAAVRLYSDRLRTLRAENQNLEYALDKTALTTFDQASIHGVKKNSTRFTTKARVADKIVATACIPGNFSDLRFIVEDADGNIIDLGQNILTARVIDMPQTAIASLKDSVIYPADTTQSVEIIYDPRQKLKPGSYTFQVFNKQDYVGTIKIKLQ